MTVPKLRLTSLAHGGGCGCKLAPSVLQQLLGGQAKTAPYAQLLVGVETDDDAAVWRVDDDNCIIATTDYFMPIVDDPRDFGRIAATNAISDVYAMGGRPLMALAILGIPLDKVPLDIRADTLPLLHNAVSLVRDGVITGASGRNWASYGDSVVLPPNFPDRRCNLLTDPQTSGGLLIACAADRADAILQQIVAAGYPAARRVGQVEMGMPVVRIEA